MPKRRHTEHLVNGRETTAVQCRGAIPYPRPSVPSAARNLRSPAPSLSKTHPGIPQPNGIPLPSKPFPPLPNARISGLTTDAHSWTGEKGTCGISTGESPKEAKHGIAFLQLPIGVIFPTLIHHIRQEVERKGECTPYPRRCLNLFNQIHCLQSILVPYICSCPTKLAQKSTPY